MKKRQRSSLDRGAGSSATAAPSTGGACPENSVAAYVSTDDADALDCGVCYLPLKPPIFQCDVGHVVCAACRDKVAGAAGKCHVCGVAMAGGYRRCHAMERMVEAVRAPCLNAAYGCGATPAYHARDEHLRACPHAPCHCPSEACGFAGSRAALLGHISAAHGWPCITEADANDYGVGVYTLRLQDGFNFLLADCTAGNESSPPDVKATVRCLLLPNVVRQPFNRTISVVWIDSHARAAAVRGGEGQSDSKEMICDLVYCKYWQRDVNNHNGGYQLMDHSQRSVACTDLSNGMPNLDRCFQFLLPSSVTDGIQHDKVTLHCFLL